MISPGEDKGYLSFFTDSDGATDLIPGRGGQDKGYLSFFTDSDGVTGFTTDTDCD